jgi:hypothetical protein
VLKRLLPLLLAVVSLTGYLLNEAPLPAPKAESPPVLQPAAAADQDPAPLPMPEGHLSIEAAQEILEALLAAHRMYGRRDCLLVMVEGEDSARVEFAVRHDNGGECGGDENVAPVHDRFAVDRVSGALWLFRMPEGEWEPLRREDAESRRCWAGPWCFEKPSDKRRVVEGA